ncbi:MAG: DNA-deoxyinosine glycosylase [Clostridia bacterium]|nr:DNA-deoxyinosine glycosylase [Clostridia bacterium]
MLFKGFDPVFDERSELLILGSFPSVKSREDGFYYGNKRNVFWQILRDYFNDKFGDEREEKINFLLKRRIALWDIVESCEIEGSSDSKISNYRLADLDRVLSKAKIRGIILNGKKSFELFSKAYKNLLPLAVCLPSTSPANVGMDREKWICFLDKFFSETR